jgi:uncharacterized protein (TIGR03435 family)
VVDSTGLTGRYAVTFEFSPDDAASARASGIPDGGGAADPGASPAAFRRAVETQLGLQLKSEKRPVDVLVIDAVARPTPD